MARNHYQTKQRDSILNIIQTLSHEFTIKDIYQQISADTSLTTIYRVVDSLEKDGLIHKSVGVDGNIYYEYIKKCHCNHFYLKCDHCGKLTHIECDFIDELSNHIIHDHKFFPEKEHIIINGLCNHCYEEMS